MYTRPFFALSLVLLLSGTACTGQEPDDYTFVGNPAMLRFKMGEATGFNWVYPMVAPISKIVTTECDDTIEPQEFHVDGEIEIGRVGGVEIESLTLCKMSVFLYDAQALRGESIADETVYASYDFETEITELQFESEQGVSIEETDDGQPMNLGIKYIGEALSITFDIDEGHQDWTTEEGCAADTRCLRLEAAFREETTVVDERGGTDNNVMDLNG